MPLRAVLRYLLNNEQLIQKLAESYPVRRAAQLTAYVFHRGKELGEEGMEKLKSSDSIKQFQFEAQDKARQTSEKVYGFTRILKKELQEGLKEMNEKIKKDR